MNDVFMLSSRGRGFQYLLVRLKVSIKQDSDSKKKISIPLGTIKSGYEDLTLNNCVISIPLGTIKSYTGKAGEVEQPHFNTSWYD